MGILESIGGFVKDVAPSVIGIFAGREDRKTLEAQSDLLRANTNAIAQLEAQRVSGQNFGSFGGPSFPAGNALSPFTPGINPNANQPGFRPANLRLPTVLPGGSPAGLPGAIGSLAIGGLAGTFADRLFGGGDMTLPVVPLSPGGQVPRPARTLQFINPNNGNVVTYKNMGRCVLYSGDLASCKRVAKVARRARVASPRRRTAARRRR